MKNFKLTVKTPGRMLYIRNKLCRTPLTFIGTEIEINKIKSKFKSESINDYLIEENVEVENKNVRIISKQNQEQNNNKEIKHETILESFLNEEKFFER